MKILVYSRDDPDAEKFWLRIINSVMGEFRQSKYHSGHWVVPEWKLFLEKEYDAEIVLQTVGDETRWRKVYMDEEVVLMLVLKS